MLFQSVHFGFVSREEDVDRSALLDLPGQQARSPEVEPDPVARLLLIAGRNFLESIAQADSRGNQDLGSIGRTNDENRRCCNDDKSKVSHLNSTSAKASACKSNSALPAERTATASDRSRACTVKF